jgi:hypothetical protein
MKVAIACAAASLTLAIAWHQGDQDDSVYSKKAAEVRAELQHLLAYENDEQFLIEVQRALEKRGLRFPMMAGSALPIGHGYLLRFGAGTPRAIVLQSNVGSDYKPSGYPFAVFVSSKGITSEAPAGDALRTADLVVGLPSGAVAVLSMERELIAFLGRE